MKPRKSFLILSSLVLLLFVVACAGETASNQEDTQRNDNEDSSDEGVNGEVRDITIATGAQAGTWSVIMSAVADHIEREIPGVRVTVITGGGIENLIGLENRQYDIGMSYSSTANEALTGTGPFSQKLENIRALTGLYMSPWQLAVDAASDIHEIEDMKGKRFSPGIKGFTSAAIAEMVFEVHGVSFDDLESLEYVDQPEAASLIRDGHLDGMSPLAADPTPVIQELASSGEGVRIIGIRDEKIGEIKDINDGYSEYLIEEGTYQGQDEGVQTIGTIDALYVREDMDEELLYQILEVMFDNQESLIAIHELMKNFTLENAPHDLGAPLHPASEKFFKDNGALE